jgi:general stress protein 26
MDTHKHLYELVEHFRTAMLITHGQNGSMRARPMAVARLAPGSDAYFATSVEMPKVQEILFDPNVLISFQGSSEYAVIEGTAELVRDRRLIEELWQESWRAWFPGGREDPALCLIKVTPRCGEYWDNSGAEGISYLFEGVRAIFQGRRAKEGPAQHAKVDL